MTTRTLPRWRVGTTPRPTVKPFEPGPCADGGQGAVGRTCDKGARLCGKNPGFTPARHGVHSTDINGPDVNVPSGIAGILRLFFGVRRKCACDVSTMDTHTPSGRDPRGPLTPENLERMRVKREAHQASSR